MAWWQWLVGILMFILALGVLVGIHELGHLSAAKLFHVYCVDYSIGFGPKLLQSKKSKKHETTWTLRAIPLGGFVAMYGEGMELEGNEYIPPSRSLEGVARYKRAIIISAGVILNFILGFVLILLHNGCFDHVSVRLLPVSGDQYSTMLITSKKDDVTIIKDKDAIRLAYDPLNSVYILDETISVASSTDNYVLVTDGSLSTTKTDPKINLILYGEKSIEETINDSIKAGYKENFFKSIYVTNHNIDTSKESEVKKLNEYFTELYKKDKTIINNEYKNEMTTYYKGIKVSKTVNKKVVYTPNANASNFKADLAFYEYDEKIEGSFKYRLYNDLKTFDVKVNSSKNGWDDIGVYLKRTIERYDAAKTFSVTWSEWCGANSTIFTALGKIFTGDIANLGGPVAIARVSSTVLSNFGFERYLYLWGQISCNLAIINLLPFPGLDGWSLLVIGYEAIRKKQIPMKVKAIISVVGLLLLFGLMFVILIKDIVGIFA